MYTVKATQAPMTTHFQIEPVPAYASRHPGRSGRLAHAGRGSSHDRVGMMRVRDSRIGREDERLDRHRHRKRRHAHAAEIDVVEVPQPDAVEHEHLGGDLEFFLEDAAKCLRDVAVDDDEERLAGSDRPRHRIDDAASQRGEPWIRRFAGPAEGNRDLDLPVDEIEADEVMPDGRGHL